MMRRAMPRTTRRSSRGLRGRLARLVRPALATALLAVSGVLALAFVAIAVQGNAVAREITATKAEIALLQAERTARQAAAAVMSTDDYVVQRARAIGYVRPGESLIAVQRADAVPAVVMPNERTSGRLARWLALFFH